METQSVEEEDQKSLVKKEFHMKPATTSRLDNVAASNDATPSINTTREDFQPVSKEPRWPKIRGRVDFLNFECNLAFHYSSYI